MSVDPQELKGYCKRVAMSSEGGSTFYLLEGLRLPEGCSPSVVDGLLCASARNGYPSRLYFSEKISCKFSRNWVTNNAIILGRRWQAFSWKVEPAGLTLALVLIGHLEGFTRA
jgi:hypothetical protein